MPIVNIYRHAVLDMTIEEIMSCTEETQPEISAIRDLSYAIFKKERAFVTAVEDRSTEEIVLISRILNKLRMENR